MGTTDKVLSYLLAHYEGAVIQVTGDPIDSRALNAFCVWVPDVGRVWLLLRWEAETHRSVVTINLPGQGARANAA